MLSTSEVEPNWVRKQRKTFRKWCNEHLKERDLAIDDFSVDLRDGQLLVHLLEILSREKLRTRAFKTGKNMMKMHCIQNLNLAFDCIHQQNLVLVNIQAEDIFDGKLNLILGLIWTLILRFQIQAGTFLGGKETSVKKELLMWCQSVLGPQDIEVSNFKECWSDGRAICGLVNSIAYSIDISQLDPEEKEKNLELGFSKAFEEFQIPQLIDSEDMLDSPDELSVMTYVSYFRHLSLLKKNLVADPLNCVGSVEVLSKVHVGKPVTFKVFSKTKKGETCTEGGRTISAVLSGTKTDVKLPVKDLNNGTYEIEFEPQTEGEFELNVKMDGVEISGSPYKFLVLAAETDANASIVYGKGIGENAEKIKSSENAEFVVVARDKFGKKAEFGGHKVKACIKLNCEVIDNEDGSYSISYKPEQKDISLEVLLDGKQVMGKELPVCLDMREDYYSLAEKKRELEALSVEWKEVQEAKKAMEEQLKEEKDRLRKARMEISNLKTEMAVEVMEKEKVLNEHLQMQQELKSIKKEVEEKDENISKVRNSLQGEIYKLRADLTNEKEARQIIETVKNKMEEEQGELEEKITELEKNLDTEIQAKENEVRARKKIEILVERLHQENAAITEKYNEGVIILQEVKEKEKIYKQEIKELQERVSTEDAAKKELEILNSDLITQLGAKENAQEELEFELKKVTEKLIKRRSHKLIYKLEEKKLKEQAAHLETQLHVAKQEKAQLEELKYKMEREISKRRHSRLELQEEVDSLKFKLQVQSDELLSEKRRRQIIEQDLEDLKNEVAMETPKVSHLEGELEEALRAKKQVEELATQLQQKLTIMSSDHEEALQTIKKMDVELSQTAKERDNLKGLKKKLKEELRERRQSILFFKDKVSELTQVVTEKQKREEFQEQQLRILKKKFEAENRARAEMENLSLKLEQELKDEIEMMVPSSKYEQLEKLFHDTKTQLELKLAAKQELLSIKEESLLTMEEEKKNEEKQRRKLERRLERVKERMEELEKRPKPSELPTVSSQTRLTEKLQSRSPTAGLRKAQSELNVVSRSNRRNAGWVGSRSPRRPMHSQSSELIESSLPYKARKGDTVDEKLAETLNSMGLSLEIKLVRPGLYKLGRKNVNIKILNGYLVIRVGGGYMKFPEWLDKYGTRANVKICTDTLNTGEVGVHVRRGGDIITLSRENSMTELLSGAD